MFTDDDCIAGYSVDYLGIKLNKYEIEKAENIIFYLTTEEIAKANKNELTEEDISNIVSRIFESSIIEGKTKKAN